jgi:DNA-binding NarL/FixJ family response regulator
MAQFPVRVLIADDNEMVRTGLASFLDAFPHLEIVGEAENGEEVLVMCRVVKPDVLITDLNMPIMDGIKLTQHIMQEHPVIKVIVVTASLDENRQDEALQVGAVMCIQKDSAFHELPDIILKVCTLPAL